MSRQALIALIESLNNAIKKIKLHISNSEWGEYYSFTNYSSRAFREKERIISDFLEDVKPKMIWDLGANTGLFSRIASKKGINTIAFDIDYLAVEKNYLVCIKNRETKMLPLFLDLTNPSPSIGWAHKERMSLIKRGPADMIMALALIHHLAISNNLPFALIADFFNKICYSLIIEFVPKSDSKVQKLLSTREDIFPNYTRESFEHEFSKFFNIKKIVKIKDSDRILYLMQTLKSI